MAFQVLFDPSRVGRSTQAWHARLGSDSNAWPRTFCFSIRATIRSLAYILSLWELRARSNGNGSCLPFRLSFIFTSRPRGFVCAGTHGLRIATASGVCHLLHRMGVAVHSLVEKIFLSLRSHEGVGRGNYESIVGCFIRFTGWEGATRPSSHLVFFSLAFLLPTKSWLKVGFFSSS
jgi:hypothetical protein